MTITSSKRLIDVVLLEPLDLVKAQPHQILLSTGSIALMGQFAGNSGVLDPLIGYLIAGGVEWAYLRGLASDSRAPTRWGDVLNWSAFFVVVLWGVLWVAQFTGAITPHQGGWWMAAAHVVPIAWLSLCSAQTHRAAARAEHLSDMTAAAAAAELERTRDEERRHFEQEQEAKDRELQRWKEAYAHKKSVTEHSGVTVSQQVSQGVTTPNRDDLRAAVVTAIVTHGASLNVTKAAAEIGISRALFYKLRDEARATGELGGTAS